jgi:beta-glucanase (GH16 family)
VVTLQSKTGGSWKEADAAELGADGTADFVVEGADASYRVVAEASEDLTETTQEVDTPGWEVDFGDEFDGSELGNAWFHRGEEYNPDGLRACSKGSPEAVHVARGTLNLQVIRDPERTDSCVAKKADGKSLGRYAYRLNGHVGSGSQVFQGVTAARIKFQQGRGQHGSFWFQSPSNQMADPSVAGAEIDVVEYFGDDDKDRLASFIHYPTEDGYVKEGDWIENARDFLAKDDEWWKSYHVFSLEWTADEYVIRIDGQEAWRTDEGISGQPEVIALSLLSSDYELPKANEEGLPQTMSVDWVRHWTAG